MNIEPKLEEKTLAHIATVVVLIERGIKPAAIHELLVMLAKMANLDGQLQVLRQSAKEPA